ncbi:hypothetical protein K439DRAFT_1658656 [Ramaria rubella]|nr:hypothetical protein K439DRAFT_1658656 [Ramaria rubella]
MVSNTIVISDDSDKEQEPFINKFEYTSDDSEIVVVGVSSPPLEPPSSSQPQSSQGGARWESSDVEWGGDTSDVEFMDSQGLIRSQSRMMESGSQFNSSDVYTSPESRKRKSRPDIFVDEDSDDSLAVEAPKKSTKRRRKTDEEKALEKSRKDAEKLKRKEETLRKKEEAAAKKIREKADQKTLRDANKLVVNKKDTLKDMTIELSPSLLLSDLCVPLKDKMSEFNCGIQALSDTVVRNSITDRPTDLDVLGIKLVRWKRRIEATFDETTRKWIPIAKEKRYTRTEGTYLIYVTGDDVLRSLSQNSTPTLRQQARALREALGPKHHIHLMLCGWKGKAPRKEVKERVEKELVSLQVREGVFIEQVPDESEAVNWIYNMSADLGIKPHKLIERSHLPFCAFSSSGFKVGKTDADTMAKMLEQLPRLTEPAAKAIVEQFGTFNGLMEAYEQADRDRSGPMMLANVEVQRTKTGKEVRRVLNKALSERLYSVLWASDPKALVN